MERQKPVPPPPAAQPAPRLKVMRLVKKEKDHAVRHLREPNP